MNCPGRQLLMACREDSVGDEFRMLALRAEMLQLELENFDVEFAMAQAMFRRDFVDELAFKNAPITQIARRDSPSAWSPIRRDLKPVYRALAKQLHPDIRPDDPKAAAEFQRVSAAHSAGDAVALLAAACRHGVDASIGPDAMAEFTAKIEARLFELERRRNRVE